MNIQFSAQKGVSVPMKMIPFLVTAMLTGAILPVQAQQTQLRAPSQITKAVVYQGQSMLSREVNLKQMATGEYQLLIPDMPLNIYADSLSITGQGSAKFTIYNVQLAPLPPNEESKAVQTIRQELKQLEKQLAALQINESSLDATDDFLEMLGAKIEKQLHISQLAIKEWTELMQFMAKSKGQLTKDALNYESWKAEVSEKIKKVSQKLNEAQQNQQLKTQSAIVHFAIKEKGDVTIQLNYLMTGVNWTPSYEARLDEKNEKLNLTYFGDVVQNTNETWPNIQLSLSTATPMLNAVVPQLYPWLLTQSAPGQLDNLLNAPAKPRAQGQLRADSGPGGERDDRDEGGEYEESAVQTQGLSVRFAIAQPITLESTPYPRKVAIATRSFKYESEYHVVPKISPLVYLKARFRNTSDLPWLPGKVRNYVDMDYTGTNALALIRPNEEASLNFGVDENIKVTRKEEAEKATLEGLLKDTKRRLYAYDIDVSNYKNKPQKVVVFDHVPVSQYDKIRVETLTVTPTATETTKLGIHKWVLMLKPWEKKTIRVQYAIEHPVDLEIYTNFTNKQEYFRRENNEYQKLR